MSSEDQVTTPEDESPYVCECARCGNGLLRLYRCDSCQKVAAMCDECELIWSDISAVYEDPETPSSGMFPVCPACGLVSDWTRLESEDALEAGLDDFITGTSP